MSSLSLIDSMTLAFWSPGPAEMLVLAVVALLLYGGNLPEVARSWGKSFAEFRRGLSGFQSELNEVIYSEPEQIAYHEEPGRDDSRYAEDYQEPNDYEATDEYQDESATLDDKVEDSVGDPVDDNVDEVNDSDLTVKNAGSDTIVIEDVSTEDAVADGKGEKPTD